RRPKPTGPSKMGECGAGSSSSPEQYAFTPRSGRGTVVRARRAVTARIWEPVGLPSCLLGRHHHARPRRAVADLAAGGTEQAGPYRAAPARADHRQLRRTGPCSEDVTRITEFDVDRDVQRRMARTQPVDRFLQ